MPTHRTPPRRIHAARPAPWLAVALALSAGALAAAACGGGAAPAADPHEAFHAACVADLNALRATAGRPPLARWREAEGCVDQQATADQVAGVAQQAWVSGPSACNGVAQNECLGFGAENLQACLDVMWAERNQATCSGCDACAGAFDPSCPGCDYYGLHGPVCGHYVNMGAEYVTKVACGLSATGGWIAMNFQ